MIERLGQVILFAAFLVAALLFAGAWQDFTYHTAQTITYGMGWPFLIVGGLVLLAGYGIKLILSGP